MTYVWLMVGFILLIKGADCFVAGSSSVAKILRIPSVIIGLTVVAFGTSAPEFAVSLSAALAGNNDIAVGNVVGSNIFNLLAILGVCGIIKAMHIDKSILNRDFWYSIGAAALLLLLVFFDNNISRLDGLIMLAAFGFFLFYTIRSALANRSSGEEAVEKMSVPKSLLFIVLGLAGVVLGGDMVVDSASKIATMFGMSQTLVGLTIVSIGTSLPELVTSIVASRRGDNGIALGNVIGSNIFNILAVLSISSIIHPIAVNGLNIIDIICLIVFILIGWVLCRTRHLIDKKEAIFMVLMYVAYLAYIIIR